MTARLLAVALAACVSGAAAHAGDVTVTVSGVVPNGTAVSVALCAGSLDPSACAIGARQAGAAPTLRFTFGNVPPGRYAVAAFQDLNGSGRMERSGLGLPLNPFAFSNDAGRARRPSFEAAAVSVGEGGRAFQLRLRGLKDGDQ